jgi:glycosyltransferase involved in cell wall biosynthesis
VRYKCVRDSYAISAMDVLATAFHRQKGYFDLVDRFVTTNAFMYDMMVEAGYSRDRLSFIPTFTDLDVFSPDGAPAQPPYIAYVGRLDEPKGVDVLVEAIARPRPHGARLPLLKIAGAGHIGSYVEALQAQIKRLGLGERVQLLGDLDENEVAGVLRGAICSVAPALWFENMPNALIESLACGTPVVASNLGSLATAITDGVDGLLFKRGDHVDLGEKIEMIASDPALRARLAAGARATAVGRHAPKDHVRRLVSLFEQTIAARAASASNTA